MSSGRNLSARSCAAVQLWGPLLVFWVSMRKPGELTAKPYASIQDSGLRLFEP